MTSSDRFVPVALGRWETRLHWIIWVSHSLAAFLIAYNVSNGPAKQWINHWMSPSSYFTGMVMDLSDSEWLFYRRTVEHLIFDYSVHSVAIFLIMRLLRNDIARYAIVSIGISLQIHMTSIQCVVVLSSFCAFVTILSVKYRSQALSWILCISFVLKASDHVPFTLGEYTYYREFNIYLYGAIKVLNFCLYVCKNPKIQYSELLGDHLLYMSYLPYSMTLIVLFEDFTKQWRRREVQISTLPHPISLGIDIRSVIWFGLRLSIWFLVFEMLLHFLYVHSLFNSPFTIIASLNKYELSAIAYVAGQLFHLKYVIIFGLPSLFAYIDGLQPPPAPICISRVSRYSRMWRHFDAGLYQFLKNQVYIPLMRPTLPPILSAARSAATLIAVFGVVLAWHGSRTHYVCWVSLSACELIIEWIGKSIWISSYFQKLRIMIGERNTRRIISLCMLFTVIPGIFGVFFFLGQDGIGSTIFNEVLLSGIHELSKGNVSIAGTNSGSVLTHLLILGYFFNNVCLDFEQDRAHH